MKLRTENVQLGAYVMAKGALLEQARVSDTAEGVTVVFEIDCLGLGDVSLLRDEFYRGLGGTNVANYYEQLGLLSEQMFTAIHRREAERRQRERSAGGGATDVVGDDDHDQVDGPV